VLHQQFGIKMAGIIDTQVVFGLNTLAAEAGRAAAIAWDDGGATTRPGVAPQLMHRIGLGKLYERYGYSHDNKAAVAATFVSRPRRVGFPAAVQVEPLHTRVDTVCGTTRVNFALLSAAAWVSSSRTTPTTHLTSTHPRPARRLWLQRPLPQQLLHYAAADVRFLLPLAAALLSELKASAASGFSTAHAYLMARPPPALSGANAAALAVVLGKQAGGDAGGSRGVDGAFGVVFELRLDARGVPTYTLFERSEGPEASEWRAKAQASGHPEERTAARAAAAAPAADDERRAGGCGGGGEAPLVAVEDEGLASMMKLLPERCAGH
jgi:hypothetical protein